MAKYWPQIIELDDEHSPTFIMCENAEDAAYSQINQFLELTSGEITSGVVRVWPFDENQSQARVFGWQVEISMPDEQPEDLEEDEIEMEAEVTLEERIQ